MSLNQRVLLIVAMIVVSALYIVPWEKYGVQNAFLDKKYTLGLDLQGGVELDYKVDFDAVQSSSGKIDNLRTVVVEDIKKTIDDRVKSLGLSEPNIQDARYGNDSHIIVQIPTQAYSDLSPEERERRNAEDIKKAKDVIGRVVKLEFREQKDQVTEADKEERKALATKAEQELKADTPFDTVGQKYSNNYENVIYYNGSGALPPFAQFPDYQKVEKFPYLAPVFVANVNPTMSKDGSGNIIEKTDKGYSIVKLNNKIGEGTGALYDYSFIFIDERPSLWQPAKTADGKILNDQYLVAAGNTPNERTGAPQVTLVFNDEGKKIFAEITKRLVGKQLAIFVGSDKVMDARVNEVIPSGEAVISGDYTHAETKALKDKINAGKVAAPIYLTSERTIDAKIGQDSLSRILVAGLVGLAALVVFLVYFYHIGGLLAGIALIVYTLILIALVKASGAVMTLASIAGVILSIGLAIDANILIFERMREALRDGQPMEKAITIGFDKSWSAIWDSHITSFTSALILFWFGISMIKGFGFMLGVGILLSLFTAMWVSRILLLWVGRKLKNKPDLFIGYKK